MSDSWNEFLDEWEMNAKISDEWHCYISIDEANLMYAMRKLRWECTRIIKSLGIVPCCMSWIAMDPSIFLESMKHLTYKSSALT